MFDNQTCDLGGADKILGWSRGRKMHNGTSQVTYYYSWQKISFLSRGIPSPSCSNQATIFKKYISSFP